MLENIDEAKEAIRNFRMMWLEMYKKGWNKKEYMKEHPELKIISGCHLCHFIVHNNLYGNNCHEGEFCLISWPGGAGCYGEGSPYLSYEADMSKCLQISQLPVNSIYPELMGE
jgi:hypothetical protein